MAKYRPNIARLYPQRQTPRPSVYDLTNQQRRRGPSKDGDLVNLLAKGTSLGYSLPTATTEAALETYIKGLKDAGIWTKLDVLYVFATDGDSDFATLNLKDPDSYQCTKVNAPTFTSLEGFNGNGSSSYLNTNWSPNTNGVNYQLSSASIGVYNRTGVDTSGGTVIYGSRDSGIEDLTYELSHTNAFINSVSTGGAFTSSTTAGFRHLNRISTTQINRIVNGISETITSNQQARPTSNIFIGCLNNAGSPSGFDVDQISIFFAGDNLTTEANDFYTLTEAYMDALGKGVVA